MPLSQHNLFHLKTFAELCADQLTHESNTTLTAAHVESALHLIEHHTLFLSHSTGGVSPNHPLHDIIEVLRQPSKFTILKLEPAEYDAMRIALLSYFYVAIERFSTEHAYALTQCRLALLRHFRRLPPQTVIHDYHYLTEAFNQVAHRMQGPLIAIMGLLVIISLSSELLAYLFTAKPRLILETLALQTKNVLTLTIMLHRLMVIDAPRIANLAEAHDFFRVLGFPPRTTKRHHGFTLPNELHMALPSPP